MLETYIKKLTAAVEENTKHLEVLHNSLRGSVIATAAKKPAAEADRKPAVEADRKPAVEADRKPAAEPAKVEAAPAEVTQEPATKADTKPSIDYKALTAKIMEFAKAKGREPVVQLLNSFGANSVPELKPMPEAWDAVAKAVEAALQS